MSILFRASISSISIIYSTYGMDEKYFTSGYNLVKATELATSRHLRILWAVIGTSLLWKSHIIESLVHARKVSAVPP